MVGVKVIKLYIVECVVFEGIDKKIWYYYCVKVVNWSFEE